MLARPCRSSIGGLDAFEDRYTVALPTEKASIRPAMVRSPVPCMRTSPACWRGAALRICAAAGCGRWFADTSRNRSRRYCSGACASRTTVAAFRARQRL